MSEKKAVETCPRCGCIFGSHWSARIAALEAENARLRQENKNAVYGCCEECGIEAEVERLRWQLETLIDDTFNRTCFAGWSRLSIGADLDRRWKERT